VQPTRIELLQRMAIFGAIREDTLEFLLEQARGVMVRAGSFFFRENDEASSMFVLESGRTAVVKGWKGRDFVVHEMATGDCFGEMSLTDLFRRSAGVRAEADCRALELTAGDLLHLFERDAEQFALIQMNICREVCRRLRATDELLFRLRMGEKGSGRESLFLAA
jgi:CRP/FNR family transcriptional regulator, cyclic AMP receptor protein